MGEVWLATQLSVKRQVAVKVLPPGFAANPEAVARFLHEGQLAARLDHFNIVTVHEAGEDNGTFYLAMAYIEGESLDLRLKRDKVLPEKDALTIVRTVADALAYAWETFQLLHRDLKPANLMVDHRGRVFLMDLGLAKSLGEDTGFSLSGAVLGTPLYMSPEQAAGSTHLGIQSDMYALGATLYHLVTGSPPFTGDTTLKILNRHQHEPLPSPRSRNPQLSEGCSRLLERMLAKKPADRYGGWRALIADVDRVLAGAVPVPLEPAVQAPRQRGASAVSPAAGKAAMARQAQAALARQHQPPPGGSPAPAPRRRLLPLAIGIAAAVVLVVVLAGLVALRRPSEEGQAGAGPEIGHISLIGQTKPIAQPSPAPAPPTVPAAAPTAATPAPPAPEPPPSPAAPPPAVAAESATMAPVLAPEPAPAEPAAAAPVETTPPAVAAVDLSALARPILAGRRAEALQRWREKGGELGQGLTPEQRQAVTAQLEALADIDRQLLASLQADIGKTVEIELANEKVTCEVREVTADGIKIMQAVKQGQTSGKLGRTLPLADLSLQEKLRRLGTGETPELALQRGLLALASGRPGNARRLFGAAGGPLGQALADVLDARQAQAREDAAEQALGELLRQISTSNQLGDRDKVIAGLRSRCGEDHKRVPVARKALGEFSKEWGDSEAGKQWVPVFEKALQFPFAGDSWTVPELDIALVWVGPGRFQMGLGGQGQGRPPVQSVRITTGYWAGRFEVTQAQYEALAGANPSHTRGPRNPVENVNWADAMAFCAKLTGRERAAGRLPDGYEFRLPTEAEWEFAARGGPASKGSSFAGSDAVEEVAWYAQNTSSPQPVDGKLPNEIGMYDASGNIAEFCWDWLGISPPTGPQTDPIGAMGEQRRVEKAHSSFSHITRGGDFRAPRESLGLGSRDALMVAIASNIHGFRLFLGPVLPASAP